jgi:phosphate uptake regulator
LGYTLLIKKIERIGDQAKNILDLAEEGVSFVGAQDIDELNGRRQEISEMFGETVELLSEGDAERIESFHASGERIRHELEAKVREYMHSDERGSHAVPRAILYRYWKRIVANLTGILTTATEPLQNLDYLDEGRTDIVDD